MGASVQPGIGYPTRRLPSAAGEVALSRRDPTASRNVISMQTRELVFLISIQTLIRRGGVYTLPAQWPMQVPRRCWRNVCHVCTRYSNAGIGEAFGSKASSVSVYATRGENTLLGSRDLVDVLCVQVQSRA